jgi:subfamily B ATP-binding cassette protein MsbA
MTRVQVFLRLLRYLRKYWFHLAVGFACSVGVAGLTAAYAWLVKPFLDGIFIDKNQFLLMTLPLVLLCVTLCKGFLVYAQSYLMNYINNWVIADIRQELFSHMACLPVQFHDRHSSGRLVSRVLNDVTAMGNAVPGVMRKLIQQSLIFIALTGVAFYQNWRMAAVFLVLIPASTFAASRVGSRLTPLATRGQQLTEDLTSLLQEAFSGIRILKACGNERLESDRFWRGQELIVRTGIKSGLLTALTSPLMEIIWVSGIGAIIWYGGYQVIRGTMTPGGFFSFLTAVFMTAKPIRAMGAVNNSLQLSVASAQRVFEILDLDNEEHEDRGKPILPRFSRSLEFRNVSFRYDGSREIALTGIELTVQAGEVVAFVGSSGSGKSTMVNLVLRFYDPSGGAILVDGQDIRQVTLQSLRRQIGMVPQEPILFDDTVRNNISYGRIGSSDAEIMAAAKAAGAHEFIERLPNDYETIIGEKGVRLSGGQRQRLAIARAILRDPPILILDEATSSLDSESERIVQWALRNFMKNRTTLVIAHRLSTILNADRIVVLDRGRMVGIGSHRDLLASCEAYQRLYDAQFINVEV